MRWFLDAGNHEDTPHDQRELIALTLTTQLSLSSRSATGPSALAPAQRAGAQRLCALAHHVGCCGAATHRFRVSYRGRCRRRCVPCHHGLNRFPLNLGRGATPRFARLGPEPRRVPFDEARVVATDEFVLLDGRRVPGRRRSLNSMTRKTLLAGCHA